jgi:hypothetical protein
VLDRVACQGSADGRASTYDRRVAGRPGKENKGHPSPMEGREAKLTITGLYCQLQETPLIPLCRDLAYSPGHMKRLDGKSFRVSLM